MTAPIKEDLYFSSDMYGKYSTIVIDPPWNQGKTGKRRVRPIFYPKSQDKNWNFLMNLAFYATLLQVLTLLILLPWLIINSYCFLLYTSIGHLKSKVWWNL